MSKLTDMLNQSGIDISTMTVLYEEDNKTLYRLTVPRLEGYYQWHKLYVLAETIGYLPVIMGDDLQLEKFHHMMNLYNNSEYKDHYAIDAILERGTTLDVGAWLEEALKGTDFERSPWSDDIDIKDEEAWRIPRFYDTDLYISLIPTLRSWELPAYLKFGNFNACPFSREHVALFKRWDALVGLQVVHMSHDSIDAHMLRPPNEPEMALQLAQEHLV